MIPPIGRQGKPLRVGSEQAGPTAGRGCGKVGRQNQVTPSEKTSASCASMIPLSVLMPPRELLLNIPGKSIAISPAETTGRTSTTFTYRNNFA